MSTDKTPLSGSDDVTADDVEAYIARFTAPFLETSKGRALSAADRMFYVAIDALCRSAAAIGQPEVMLGMAEYRRWMALTNGSCTVNLGPHSVHIRGDGWTPECGRLYVRCSVMPESEAKGEAVSELLAKYPHLLWKVSALPEDVATALNKAQAALS